MENDDFDISKKVILRFADEDRPSSEVKKNKLL